MNPLPPPTSSPDRRGSQQVAPYLRRFAVAFVSLLALPAGMNLIVNPLNYYPTSVFPPRTWSTRSVRAAALDSCAGTGIIIIGSSRAMKLAPSRIQKLTGLSTYNSAVDSAMAEDYLALLRLALRHCGTSLREIVLGIDLESFHDGQGPDGRVTGRADYWAQLPPEERFRSALDALEKLVAWEQTIQSVRSVQASLMEPAVPTTSFDTDGLLHYIAWERARATGNFELDTKGTIDTYLSRFAGYRHLSPRRKVVFEQFLAETSRAAIRVRAFVTPLHADVRNALRAARGFDDRRSELLHWLKQLSAEKPSFTVVDYSEVRAFGGLENGFYDGAHIDEVNAGLLVEALYGSRADAVQ